MREEAGLSINGGLPELGRGHGAPGIEGVRGYLHSCQWGMLT
jgi:hypothetical protein